MENSGKNISLEELTNLLSSKRQAERLQKMSPEARAEYERIIKLREEIGPIDFNVVEALREIRDNGDYDPDYTEINYNSIRNYVLNIVANIKDYFKKFKI